MRHLLRNSMVKLARSLLKNGILLRPTTDRAALLRLIGRLAPVQTLRPLVRIGGDADGGYLLPDDLDGIAACFSPGVDVTASFESDLEKRWGIESHLADYSVEGPPDGLQPKSFERKFIGVVDKDIFVTLSSWVQRCEPREHDELLLQMDIEGAEYACLLATPQALLERFRVIVIEIHHVEAWADPKFFAVAEAFFDKLLSSFHVVHNHPNNCCGLTNIAGIEAPRVFEITLLRKDRSTAIGPVETLPHQLDRPNVVGRPDLALPRYWFG